MAEKKIPTAARLRELLDYDPETGQFSRRTRGPAKVGTLRYDRHGIQICIDGRICQAGMLAWLWMTGEWPSRQVDHINTNPTDNRFVNLRLATGSQNSANYAMNPRNTSGFRGLFYDPRYKKPWRVTLQRIIIGRYATKEEAVEAYRKAALELYGEFAHASLRKEPRP